MEGNRLSFLCRGIDILLGMAVSRHPLPESILHWREEERNRKEEEDGEQARHIFPNSANGDPPPCVEGVVEKRPEEGSRGNSEDNGEAKEPTVRVSLQHLFAS